jgi:hypothetical protein
MGFRDDWEGSRLSKSIRGKDLRVDIKVYNSLLDAASSKWIGFGLDASN